MCCLAVAGQSCNRDSLVCFKWPFPWGKERKWIDNWKLGFSACPAAPVPPGVKRLVCYSQSIFSSSVFQFVFNKDRHSCFWRQMQSSCWHLWAVFQKLLFLLDCSCWITCTSLHAGGQIHFWRAVPSVCFNAFEESQLSCNTLVLGDRGARRAKKTKGLCIHRKRDELWNWIILQITLKCPLKGWADPA